MTSRATSRSRKPIVERGEHPPSRDADDVQATVSTARRKPRHRAARPSGGGAAARPCTRLASLHTSASLRRRSHRHPTNWNRTCRFQPHPNWPHPTGLSPTARGIQRLAPARRAWGLTRALVAPSGPTHTPGAPHQDSASNRARKPTSVTARASACSQNSRSMLEVLLVVRSGVNGAVPFQGRAPLLVTVPYLAPAPSQDKTMVARFNLAADALSMCEQWEIQAIAANTVASLQQTPARGRARLCCSTPGARGMPERIRCFSSSDRRSHW